MLSCKQASELVSQSLDRPLPWTKRLALKFHLMICKACVHFSNQMHLMHKTAHHLQHMIESDESIKLSDTAKQNIQKRLNDQ